MTGAELSVWRPPCNPDNPVHRTSRHQHPIFWVNRFGHVCSENSLPIELDLEYDGGNQPTFEVELTTYLATGTDPIDEEPYDGIDQKRTCDPSIAFVGSQTLTLDAPTR